MLWSCYVKELSLSDAAVRAGGGLGGVRHNTGYLRENINTSLKNPIKKKFEVLCKDDENCFSL